MSEAPPEESKKIQYLALICTTLITFGDAVEMFLPAVITQPISCDLEISSEQEHIAALALYVSLAVTSIIAIPLSNRVGRKTLLLVAMYLGITITVLCSIVSNYIFLVLSRLLLGSTLALNLATAGVYMAELSTSKEFHAFSMTLLSTAFSLGGGWCGLLGYFLISRIGWRYFILFTSLPIFVPPLLLLQFYLPETLNRNYQFSEDEALVAKEAKLKSVITRIAKFSLLIFTTGFIYSGDVLLVPVIMRDINKSQDLNVPCGAIHGVQFLAITGLFGGCHIIGRFVSYNFQNRLSSTKIYLTCCFILMPSTAVCYAFSRNTIIIFTCLVVVQTFASTLTNEAYIHINDTSFFTEKYIALSAGFLTCMIQITIFVTSVVSEVVEYEKTLCAHVACAVLSFLVSLLFLFDD